MALGDRVGDAYSYVMHTRILNPASAGGVAIVERVTLGLGGLITGSRREPGRRRKMRL